jgi:hypothetical protein
MALAVSTLAMGGVNMASPIMSGGEAAAFGPEMRQREPATGGSAPSARRERGRAVTGRRDSAHAAPLKNRVDPFGDLFASPERGLLMGNRGGRFHDPVTRTAEGRPWVSSRWIACKTCFGNRQRAVWGEGYTELFFLDEVTSLSAGHRPCFECRRLDALDFAASMGDAIGASRPPSADVMDTILHGERLAGRGKAVHVASLDQLPDGAVVTGAMPEHKAYAVRGDQLLGWTPKGWAKPVSRPKGLIVGLLTPPAIFGALKAGYRPLWHPSATAG